MNLQQSNYFCFFRFSPLFSDISRDFLFLPVAAAASGSGWSKTEFCCWVSSESFRSYSSINWLSSDNLQKTETSGSILIQQIVLKWLNFTHVILSYMFIKFCSSLDNLEDHSHIYLVSISFNFSLWAATITSCSLIFSVDVLRRFSCDVTTLSKAAILARWSFWA